MSHTTDPNHPELGYGIDQKPIDQHKVYLVLSEEERAKGFVQPVRDCYTHLVCGHNTTMSKAIAETYAANPSFYGATYCINCRKHLPVGEHGEFVWLGTDQKVGTIREVEPEKKIAKTKKGWRKPENLKKIYEKVCQEYIEAFAQKHNYEFSYWVADEIGGVACFIEEYYFNIDDIRIDIDQDVESGLIFEWHDCMVLQHAEDPNKPSVDFKTYIKMKNK